jgi:uncharacterized protein YwbE
MSGSERKNIRPGLTVKMAQNQDQRTGSRTERPSLMRPAVNSRS